jgi:hypothetical protein
LIPVWNDKGRVLEKHNVYFFLDDDRGFSPNILYPGMLLLFNSAAKDKSITLSLMVFMVMPNPKKHISISSYTYYKTKIQIKLTISLNNLVSLKEKLLQELTIDQ